MDRPFQELHELYRLIYLKAEVDAKIQKEREEKEKKEAEEAERKKKADRGLSPGMMSPSQYAMRVKKQKPSPTDVNDKPQTDTSYTPSPLEVEALADMMEELSEGGVM